MTVPVVLDGLSRSFGSVRAVSGLSMSIAAGELFGIVGPDGAGKTTTLRMLAGVLPPTAGDAFIDGISVAAEPERVKPRIAYMAQRFGLYADLTVRENILFYADLYRVPRAQLRARMERLYQFSALGEFEHRLAGALSGGMKQKLSLSCALIHHPDVLLLDEPTFGVDPISRRDLWLILHQMTAEGMTIILSTSYMDEAERCDRVALLNDGRLLQLDAPAALQRRLQDRVMVARSASPRQLRDALRAQPSVAHATLFGDAVHIGLRAGATAASLADELRAAGAAVDSMVPARASLEDVYIELVGREVAVNE
jgi:ABC-2 type transport system ATP-binding protein